MAGFSGTLGTCWVGDFQIMKDKLMHGKNCE